MPQTLEAQAEYRTLLHIEANILAGSSRPQYGLVQDTICGCYLMTDGWIPIERGMWMDMASNLDLPTDQLYRRVVKVAEVLKGLTFTGKGLASLGLPDYLCLTMNNKGSQAEPTLVISNGVITEGVLNKAALGARAGSIHHIVARLHGEREGIDILTRMGRLGSVYIERIGFSVGIADCLPMDGSFKTPHQVTEAIEKAFVKARIAEQSYDNPTIRELKVTSALNAAKDIGLRLARESLAPRNRFAIMQMSGAKGSDINIAQICGLLGQQIVCGTRIKPTLNGGVRVLPHYPFTYNLDDPAELEMYYESRGFISDSYFKGLNTRAFWYQAAAGREGITDTACKTAGAGYCQRKLARLLEDLTVQYDGSVRTRTGKIIQIAYGGDGMDGSKISKIDGVYQPVNVYAIANELNGEYEREMGGQSSDLEIDLEHCGEQKPQLRSSILQDLGFDLTVSYDEEEPPSPIGSDGSDAAQSVASPQSQNDDGYESG